MKEILNEFSQRITQICLYQKKEMKSEFSLIHCSLTNKVPSMQPKQLKFDTSGNNFNK